METGPLPPRGTWIALALAAAALLGSIVYASFRDRGHVEVAAQPVASAPDPIESLAAATRSNPGDARAWTALGMAWFDRGAWAEAIPPLERAAALAPGRASLWSLLGEARIYASEREPMPAAAVAAFEKALALDAGDPVARYFMAVRKDVAKDHKGAIDDLLALLADTPPGAPWESDLRRTIDQIGRINRIEVASRIAAVKPPAAPAAMPGPDSGQIAAAAKLAPGEQDAMARGMVARLEERLKADPSNLDGWVMLMRSRMTLGEPEAARAALHAAVTANPAARARLESAAKTLGLP